MTAKTVQCNSWGKTGHLQKVCKVNVENGKPSFLAKPIQSMKKELAYQGRPKAKSHNFVSFNQSVDMTSDRIGRFLCLSLFSNNIDKQKQTYKNNFHDDFQNFGNSKALSKVFPERV